MDLKSLNDIFEKRILRIPDYQRGYAWNKHQLKDFWDDLLLLGSERVHYTGVITLEPVSKNCWSHWENDQWLIEDLGYKPYYVVDGQQRLTTSMILIQAIIESLNPGELLASQSQESIKKQFILYKADDGVRESYVFGYEKDNPSDEYLRTEIFGNHSFSNQQQETLYTRNLLAAKVFFQEHLRHLTLDQKTTIYKKITQRFKFNLYEINDEIDVFVTFETMNNRGKPLSNLELLKNRLIYLSTLFKDNSGKEKLRANINNAWKTIYEYLGKNPDDKLNDDLFLRNHWTMYFKYSRKKGSDYINFLLNEKFNARHITQPKKPEDALKIEDIAEYVKSLQQSIVFWFYMHSPYHPQSCQLTDSQALWLDRLDRLSFRSFKPLILAAFVSGQNNVKITDLLKACERYNFSLFNLSQRRANTGDTEFFSMSREVLKNKKTIDEVVSSINNWIDKYYDSDKFLDHIQDKYELGRDGFYHWDGVRYFFYEHEQWLKNKGKQATNKLDWITFTTNKKDHVTLEHVFPREAHDIYWQSRFNHLSEQDQFYLTHSLGNLLPLSRAKNSSLNNDNFDLKVNNNNGVGYYNGSVSENEVAQKPEWTPYEIQKRGIELLEFLEERWDVVLGDIEFKSQLLHVNDMDIKTPGVVN